LASFTNSPGNRGKPSLRFQEVKHAASKYMQEHGWGHKVCHERE